MTSSQNESRNYWLSKQKATRRARGLTPKPADYYSFDVPSHLENAKGVALIE